MPVEAERLVKQSWHMHCRVDIAESDHMNTDERSGMTSPTEMGSTPDQAGRGKQVRQGKGGCSCVPAIMPVPVVGSTGTPLRLDVSMCSPEIMD